MNPWIPSKYTIITSLFIARKTEKEVLDMSKSNFNKKVNGQ